MIAELPLCSGPLTKDCRTAGRFLPQRALFFSLLLLFLTFTAQAASAQGLGGLGGLMGSPVDPNKPVTDMYARSVQKFVNISTMLKSMNPAKQAQALAKTLNPKDHKYFKGNDILDIAMIYVGDILHIVTDLGRLLSCLRPRIHGICVKWTWTGPKFDTVRSYRLPLIYGEAVRRKGVTGLMPEFFNWDFFGIDGVKNWFAHMDGDGFTGVDFTEMYTKWNSEFVFKAVNEDIKTKKGKEVEYPDVQYPDKLDPNDHNALNLMRNIQGLHSEETRTNSGPMGEGFTNIEHHLLPNFFGATLASLPIPFVNMNCHRKKSKIPYYSDWMSGVFLTRNLFVNFAVFSKGMLATLKDPLGCARWDTGSYFGTFDLMNNIYALPVPAFPGSGCAEGNSRQGRYSRVGRAKKQVDYAVSGEHAVLSGIKFGSKAPFISNTVYSYKRDWHKLNDQFMWFVEDDMPGDGDCYQPPSNARDYLKAGEEDSDSMYQRMTHWIHFRCCRYSQIFICFYEKCKPYRRQ